MRALMDLKTSSILRGRGAGAHQGTIASRICAGTSKADRSRHAAPHLHSRAGKALSISASTKQNIARVRINISRIAPHLHISHASASGNRVSGSGARHQNMRQNKYGGTYQPCVRRFLQSRRVKNLCCAPRALVLRHWDARREYHRRQGLVARQIIRVFRTWLRGRAASPRHQNVICVQNHGISARKAQTSYQGLRDIK